MRRRKNAGRRQRPPQDTALDRLLALLESAPEGLHWVGEPAFLLDAAWPQSLADLYRSFDGASFFQDTLTLDPAAQVAPVVRDDGGATAEERAMRYLRVGALEGDALLVDERGRVWRIEEDTGEWLPEGTRIDRWVLGTLDAQALLYDHLGEFVDGVFEESGELSETTVEHMCRRVLKRDREAPTPRWRLARALVAQNKLREAREQLEDVVDAAPSFAWAWFDLARISEKLGELEAAADELEAAASARPEYEYTGYLWAQCARVAKAQGDEARRASAAAAALARDPQLVAAQRGGAEDRLAEGEFTGARELAELAAALAPRDLQVIELLARIRSAAEQAALADDSDADSHIDGDDGADTATGDDVN